MIIIKIPIRFTTARLEAVVGVLRLYLMQHTGAYTNGKVNGSRKDTLMYQVVLKLTDKLIRKLSDKKLTSAKDKDFKVKLNYCEAYFLFVVLLNTEQLETQIVVHIDTIIGQLDKQL